MAGESLLRHLPGCHETVSLLLDRVLDHTTGRDDSATDLPNSGIRVPDAEKEHVLRLLLQTSSSSSASDGSQLDDGPRKPLISTVLQHEWVVSCHRKGCDGDEGQLCHRLYFKDAVNEVRLGTVLVSEL